MPRQATESEIGVLKTSCVTAGIFQPDEHKTVVSDETNRVRCPVRKNTIIISRMNTEALVGANAYIDKDYPNLFLPDRLWQTVISREDIDVRYIQQVLASSVCRSHISAVSSGTSGSMKNISKTQLLALAIPLPPLAIQQEIVAEIESYQKVIDGARQVVENYRPRIKVQADWPRHELGSIAKLINGRAYKQEELLASGPTPVLRVGNFFSNRGWYYSDLELEPEKYCDAGDLLYAWSASFGPRIWNGPKAIYHYHIWKIEVTDLVKKEFLCHLLEMDSENIKAEGNGIAMVHATKGGMEKRLFPIPDIETQHAIVAEIEAEQALVNANKQLIERFEAKVKATINRVWGGGEYGKPLNEPAENKDLSTGSPSR